MTDSTSPLRPTHDAKIAAWKNAMSFTMLLVQLALMVFLIRVFSIENAVFFRIFLLAAGGFVVHAALPLRLRMPFFVLLSVTGIVLLFGPLQAAWLVILGLALIAVVHLPISFGWRILGLLVAGIVLALFRGGWWASPWSSVIWPIFGAMFMFRLIVYAYDLKNSRIPLRPWRTLSYFFMLPNVNFPLFPVVDYKTFCQSYYRVEAFTIYQTGMTTIFRGLFQLLLYRLVYQQLSVDPTSIDTAGQAALFLLRPYLLYLKISGSFHLVIGMMHLFGFDLPRTNHNYFLARSFTDYWRRINIYWKEFI